jgi:uncharacterized membrane protein (UPF0127 family)
MVKNNIYRLLTANGETICHKMIMATTHFSRMKGLMFSDSLPDCDGFLIKPCNSIHTFFMRYPLDILFLDKEFRIVKALYNLAPWKVTWIYFKSNQVLEMRAGTLKKNLNTGEKLEAICIS